VYKFKSVPAQKFFRFVAGYFLDGPSDELLDALVVNYRQNVVRVLYEAPKTIFAFLFALFNPLECAQLFYAQNDIGSHQHNPYRCSSQ